MRGIACAASHHDFAGDVSVSVDSGGCSGISARRFDVLKNAVDVDESLGILIREIDTNNNARIIDVTRKGTPTNAFGIVQRFVNAIFQNETVPMCGLIECVRTNDYPAVVNAADISP